MTLSTSIAKMTGSSPPKKQGFMSRLFSTKSKAKKTPSSRSLSSSKKKKTSPSSPFATKQPFLRRFRRTPTPSTMDKIASKLHVSSSSSTSSPPSPTQVAAAKKKKKAKKAKAKKEAEKKKNSYKPSFFGKK
ncbi:hypothetical protein BGZ52_006101 [Haplosporangium bisporale]|nr:hypothetical protein BGZ52_006101 [Haplosporangium bisporale]